MSFFPLRSLFSKLWLCCVSSWSKSTALLFCIFFFFLQDFLLFQHNIYFILKRIRMFFATQVFLKWIDLLKRHYIEHKSSKINFKHKFSKSFKSWHLGLKSKQLIKMCILEGIVVIRICFLKKNIIFYFTINFFLFLFLVENLPHFPLHQFGNLKTMSRNV